MDTKRILLVGASSGWGHMKAADNIACALSEVGSFETETIDIFRCLPFGLEFLTGGGWRLASQYLDPAYSRLYKNWTCKSGSHLLSSSVIERIAERLASQVRLDTIQVYVATHSVAAAVGAFLKPRYDYKLCVVATDFVLHSFQIYPAVDFFYVPPRYELHVNEEDSRTLAGRTIETGIPIAPDFDQEKDKKRLRRELGLDESLATVLVSFGGGGLRAHRHVDLCDQLLSLGFPLQFIVLAGRSKRFARAMDKRYRHSRYRNRVKTYEYQDDVTDFYSASDIFVGKGGGLSISEAISAQLPIVIVDMLPGQEEFNVKVITSNGLGHYVPRDARLAWWKKNLIAVLNDAKSEKRRSFARPLSSGLVAAHVAALAQ